MAAAKGLDWELIRKNYEGGLNPAALAIKYNCSAASIYTRAVAEKWLKPIEDDDGIDPEFRYNEEEFIQVDIALYEQRRYLSRLMQELNASTSKPGQMRQWIKEGTAGNIDSRRKAMYQTLTMGNRMIMLKNAASVLKTLVEAENMMNVPKGKKAKLEKDAEELEDERFAPRKAPSARSA